MSVYTTSLFIFLLSNVCKGLLLRNNEIGINSTERITRRVTNGDKAYCRTFYPFDTFDEGLQGWTIRFANI
jgi:hypothetical protein